VLLLVRTTLLAGAALIALGPALASAQSAVGPNFLVSGYTTGGQDNPRVATDRQGNFVVVWAADEGVVARRFTAAGAPRGAEFVVRSYTAGYPRLPDVASAADGSFVVVWNSNGPDGSDYGIFGQRFDANGLPAGPELAVNSYTTGRQSQPAVAADPAGNFVVVWHSQGQTSTEYNVFGQRFDAAGTPLGAEFAVVNYTPGLFSAQHAPAVDVADDGSFVVAWVHRYAIFLPIRGRLAGQRYDAAGVAQGDAFFVDTNTAANEGAPDVAFDGAGNFMVVWSESGGFPLPTSNAAGRFYDPSGTPLGAGFALASTGNSGGALVDADRNGNFVTTWSSRAREGAQFETGVYARRFKVGTGALGSDFIVNTYTTGSQVATGVASTLDENFVIVWDGNQGGTLDVFGQRYGDLIFRDDTESGTLERWSSAATDGDDLGVSAGAALKGSTLGIEAFVDDVAPIFVQDDSPNGEGLYRARFYFDPNGFDPGEAQDHLRTRLFIGFDALGRRAFALVLRRREGLYSVMARVRLDNGGRAETAFVPITNSEHVLEVTWRRSTAPGANNGLFVLSVDTNPQILSSLDTDEGTIERVRLGALSAKAGANGSLFYDEFVSRRQDPIGP